MPTLIRRWNKKGKTGYPTDVGCAVLTAVLPDRKPLFRILCGSV